MSTAQPHEDFCAIGFSGECTCRTLPESTEPEKPSTRNYPICPRCGCNTIVMYSPPREGIVGTDEGYRLYAEKNWAEYVDWNRAHLYCCNGETDCQVQFPIIGGLMTPVNEKRYRVNLNEPRGQSAGEDASSEGVNPKSREGL